MALLAAGMVWERAPGQARWDPAREWRKLRADSADLSLMNGGGQDVVQVSKQVGHFLVGRVSPRT